MAKADPGFKRWYVFIPNSGKWLVPASVSDREAYAEKVGATRLFEGDRLAWSAASKEGDR